MHPTYSLHNVFAAILLAAIAIPAISGCSATARNPEVDTALVSYYAGDYAAARKTFEPLAAKNDENYVLNNLRLGSTALGLYDMQAAESAFFRAYEVMNSAKVNDPARATGTVVINEGLKIWKGEPYERAMTNFYLGMIYYMRKDYNNARAAFENALFKLRDYGENKDDKSDQYREAESDFVVAYVMLGKSWQKLGEEEHANDCFQRAAKLRPEVGRLVNESASERSNVLVLVDFGQGPIKQTGADNSIVEITPFPNQAPPLPLPRVLADNRMVDLRGLNKPPVDMVALAHQRKWQTMDTIRLVKSAAGVGLMGVGAYETARGAEKNNTGRTLTGIGLMAAGAALKASASADLRCWEMMPRTTFLLPLRLAPGRHSITVDFGQGMYQTWTHIIAPAAGEATYYIRMVPNARGPFAWPPPGASGLLAEAEPQPDPAAVVPARAPARPAAPSGPRLR